MATPAQIEANRHNARKSTGPRTEEGKRRSRRNALRHGLTGQGTALTREIEAQTESIQESLERRYPPRDAYEAQVLEQAAVAMARLSVCPDIEAAARDDAADRAANCWELDRAREAAALLDEVERVSARHVAELRTTKQGCEFLIMSWETLLHVCDGGDWEGRHDRMASALLGMPQALRDHDPRLDPKRPAEERRRLIVAQIEELKRLLEETLKDRDAVDQALATSGLAFEVSMAARRLRSYEASAFRKLNWALRILRENRAGEREEADLEPWLDDPDDDHWLEMKFTEASGFPPRSAVQARHGRAHYRALRNHGPWDTDNAGEDASIEEFEHEITNECNDTEGTTAARVSEEARAVLTSEAEATACEPVEAAIPPAAAARGAEIQKRTRSTEPASEQDVPTPVPPDGAAEAPAIDTTAPVRSARRPDLGPRRISRGWRDAERPAAPSA